MARLLADENIPRPVVQALRGAGHDVLFVTEGFPGATDRRLLQLARDEGRMLLSYDHDFGELLFARGLAAPPAVILLRIAAPSLAELSGIVVVLMARSDEFEGHFVVADNERIRLRALPG